MSIRKDYVDILEYEELLDRLNEEDFFGRVFFNLFREVFLFQVVDQLKEEFFWVVE